MNNGRGVDVPAHVERFAREHPLRQEVRIVAGATRAGATYCALRLRAHDDDQSVVDGTELVRMVATARVMMPRAMVRLSAGRTELTKEAQLLCLYAGANSIFYGDKLLTTPNPGADEDVALIRDAGLTPMAPAPSA